MDQCTPRGYITGTGTYDFGNSVTAAGTYSGYNIVLVKYYYDLVLPNEALVKYTSSVNGTLTSMATATVAAGSRKKVHIFVPIVHV